MRLRLIAGCSGILLVVAMTSLVSHAQTAGVTDASRFINDNVGQSKSSDVRTPNNAIANTEDPVTALVQLSAPTLPIEPIADDDKALCWKQTYTRGVGTIPNADCGSTQDKDAGLCYPKCRDGFKGVGPVCWRSCPDKFRDDGAFCAKPAAYGRGGGYPWKFGDPAFNLDNARGRCEADNGGSGTCEQDGAIWYPKCKAGFTKVGCCVCSPSCPSGMTDIGVSCAKETYGRNVGKIPDCGSGMVLDAGLCYPPAAQGFTGVGPVAWGKCPSEFPFECGAACAKNQAACATAVTDMTLSTIGVAINILSFVAGGPGVTAAAQTAARQAVSGVGRNYAEMGMYQVLKTTAKESLNALRANSKGFAKEFIKQWAKNKFLDPKNVGWMSAGLLKTGGLKAANEAAKEFGGLKTTDDFDWESLTALDPTGIASMVTAFTKYGNCGQESFLADVGDLDFGAVATPTSEPKTVTLSMQQQTTITEITTTPFVGTSISADSDCIGKVLQVGQQCAVKVRVSGQGKIDGAIQIYSTEYDIIPFVIGVKANPNGAPAAPVPGVDDAVNLTSVVGVWAWNSNQSMKLIIDHTGTLQDWTGKKGTVTVKDPIKRIYEFNWSGSVITMTLSDDHQGLQGQNLTAARRPWDTRCKPGELFFAGLCYDVPPGYYPTTPGFIGKPCPVKWRDDGTKCWPPWTGVDVTAQACKACSAFKNPILVTDCGNYSKAKNQTCPTNFVNTGGPLGCTCEAQGTSKEVKSLIGTMPR